MKCLYIFANAPLSESFHGAASRYTQAFKALIQLNIEVHVVRLLASHRKEQILGFEQAQPASCLAHYDLAQSWRDIEYQSLPAYRSKGEGVLKGLFRPLHFAFPEIEPLRAVLLQTIGAIQPDFIVAQMYPAGALVAATQHNVPWVFGHHDWVYRDSSLGLASLGRRKSLGARFRYWVKRNAEIAVARKSEVVIAASITEGRELQKLGVKQVYVIPATYESVPVPSADTSPQSPLRIVHFGQLTTRANAIGLNDYLTQVVPILPKNWEFYVIGAYEGAESSLIDRLKEAGTILLGRIDDLTTAFRPFDVSVIPFQHNTGERTKVAQLFNHSQVVVAHEQAVAGIQYIRPGENCFVLPDLKAFPGLLTRLADDQALRRRIGLAAKATFERELTLEAQLPQFQQAFMAVQQRI